MQKLLEQKKNCRKTSNLVAHTKHDETRSWKEIVAYTFKWIYQQRLRNSGITKKTELLNTVWQLKEYLKDDIPSKSKLAGD